MSCNVAFIGLGVMGYPMAGYISKGGHNVTVFNRTKTKAEKWITEHKGKMAETPAEAAKDADYVFTCVGNDNDLREVTFGEKGIFKTIKKGAVYIDNTTASATIAREIYDYAKKNGFGSLDAPVSGGQAGAENGALTVMIGGDQADFDKAKDKIDCYSKKMKLLGKAGCGQLAKMVNQICIAGLVQGLSEGINFGIKAGLKMEDVIEVISKGAAGYSAKRARQEGSELCNPRLSPLVVKYIGQLKEERIRKHEVTYEGHVAELARLREAALKKGSFSSAVNAEANRGKAAGLYIDRKIIKTGKLEDLSEAELENKMKQILSDYEPLLNAKTVDGESSEIKSSESSLPKPEES